MKEVNIQSAVLVMQLRSTYIISNSSLHVAAGHRHEITQPNRSKAAMSRVISVSIVTLAA